MSEQGSNIEVQPKKGEISPDVQERRGMLPTTGTGAMRPVDLGEMMEFARILCGSGMVPDSYRNKAGATLVAIQMGAELGLQPMQALQNIAVINGRPTLWGDAILAVVQGHAAFDGIEEMDMADIGKAGAATCILRRKGSGTHRATFSVEDAKLAGLWKKKGPWTQYPNRMLLLRARAFACRNLFPDALRGIACAEEVRDIPQPQEVRATATVTGSAPASIASRILERQADAPVDETPEPEAPPVETPDAPPAEQDDNGEMSAEDEAAAFGDGTD